MTEFLHEPIEKIIVKNLIHENLDNLISQCNQQFRPQVFWVNGMIISIPRIIVGADEKKYDHLVKGVQYFEKVVFVKFPKYAASITKKNCVDYVRLLDYSNNNKFNELANWIESQPIWNTVPVKTKGDEEIDE